MRDEILLDKILLDEILRDEILSIGRGGVDTTTKFTAFMLSFRYLPISAVNFLVVYAPPLPMILRDKILRDEILLDEI